MNKCDWTTKANLSWKCRFGLLGFSFIIIILDQITKEVARHNLMLYQVKPFVQYWSWTLAYNKGAAFSFLADQSGWQKLFFGLVALIVSICLVYYILNRSYSRLSGIALSFILGGALGNLIDRILYGEVTDFVLWYYRSHSWPAFNVADSFITVGITLLIIENVFFGKKNS